MKKVIIPLITVATLVLMLMPAVSPPPVAAQGASVDFKQYANEDDEWINGILNKNNSEYYECMSVPQRAIFAGIPSTADDVHTLTFSHETTKGGIHAYDWLTAYNQGNQPPLPYLPCGEQIGNTPDFATICGDLHSSGYPILVDVPDDPFISKDGSTQTRIVAYEAEFGNRQIKIYGNEEITAANLTLSHNVDPGEDDGDSDIEYVLTWTSNSTQILIEMAGHIALNGDPTNPIAWGPGLGASYVSGGPYHFKLGKLDGASLGSQDNPIKGADILERVGTIVAHKFNDLNGNGVQDAGEGDLEDWTMTLYEGSSCNGTLVASGTTGSDGNVVFDGLPAGTYSVKEDLKDYWANSTALCQQATVNVGETVTLDFGNVELVPDIDVEKTASPTSGAASTNVTFTITVENTGELTLDPVKVVDTIPAGMSYVSTGTSPAPDSSKHNQDGTWTVTWDNVGSLDPEDTTTIYLVAHIDGDVLGTLTNSVTATGTPPHGDDVEDTDTANVLVYHAGIDVEKTVYPGCGGPSANITFTIVVTNTNGSVLDPVIVVDTLPDGMSYVSDDAGGTESPEGTITWDLGSLASGNSTTIHLVASIDGDELGNLTNEVTATGTPPHGDDVEDTDTADVLAIDAKISITPAEGVNIVGDEHLLTVTVEIDDGDDWEPYEGATVTLEVTDGPGELASEIVVTGSSGQATTTLTSTVAGNSTVTASTSICGYAISTDGTANNSDPAKKKWIYARIKIDPPHDTNVVGDLHGLTATVETSANNITWDPYEGATVTFEVTSGPGDLDPEMAVTNSSGQATTTLTSTEAGNSTVTASTTVYDHDLSTDGEAYNSDPAEKEWVYARIRITPPDDTNLVGDPHGFTATVETSTNNINWDPYEGATVTFLVTSGPGTLDPVTDVTDVDGEAETTLTSTQTGTSTVEASTTVYGHALSTDGEAYNSDPAEKRWVDARISIVESGVNPVGTPHTFTVHVEKNEGQGAGWVDVIGVSVNGTISGIGSITSTLPAITDGNGEITITVNSTVAGTATVHASATVSIGDIYIPVATNGYGAFTVHNIKTWTSPNVGPSGCPCQCGSLTVDWEGNNTTKPLWTNDKLAVDLLGPSPDGSDNLFLERGTHAPVVGTRTYYLIVVRELGAIPPVPENYEAIVVLNVTPTDADFNKDIFLTVGLNETQLPENVLNLTMAYYDDINGLWESLDYEAGGPNGVAEITLSAPINHFSIYGVLAKLGPTTPTQPAHFVPSGLSITPSVEKSIFVTTTGETVTITANIVNDGGEEGTYDVALKLNGQTIDTETVTVGAGQTKQVSFTESGLGYGQYEVEVAGLTGEFTASRAIAWWLIILIIVAIGLIIWGVVWARRRRKAQQEA